MESKECTVEEKSLLTKVNFKENNTVNIVDIDGEFFEYIYNTKDSIFLNVKSKTTFEYSKEFIEEVYREKCRIEKESNQSKENDITKIINDQFSRKNGNDKSINELFDQKSLQKENEKWYTNLYTNSLINLKIQKKPEQNFHEIQSPIISQASRLFLLFVEDTNNYNELKKHTELYEICTKYVIKFFSHFYVDTLSSILKLDTAEGEQQHTSLNIAEGEQQHTSLNIAEGEQQHTSLNIAEGEQQHTSSKIYKVELSELIKNYKIIFNYLTSSNTNINDADLFKNTCDLSSFKKYIENFSLSHGKVIHEFINQYNKNIKDKSYENLDLRIKLIKKPIFSSIMSPFTKLWNCINHTLFALPYLSIISTIVIVNIYTRNIDPEQADTISKNTTYATVPLLVLQLFNLLLNARKSFKRHVEYTKLASILSASSQEEAQTILSQSNQTNQGIVENEFKLYFTVLAFSGAFFRGPINIIFAFQNAIDQEYVAIVLGLMNFGTCVSIGSNFIEYYSSNKCFRVLVDNLFDKTSGTIKLSLITKLSNKFSLIDKENTLSENEKNIIQYLVPVNVKSTVFNCDIAHLPKHKNETPKHNHNTYVAITACVISSLSFLAFLSYNTAIYTTDEKYYNYTGNLSLYDNLTDIDIYKNSVDEICMKSDNFLANVYCANQKFLSVVTLGCISMLGKSSSLFSYCIEYTRYDILNTVSTGVRHFFATLTGCISASELGNSKTVRDISTGSDGIITCFASVLVCIASQVCKHKKINFIPIEFFPFSNKEENAEITDNHKKKKSTSWCNRFLSMFFNPFGKFRRNESNTVQINLNDLPNNGSFEENESCINSTAIIQSTSITKVDIEPINNRSNILCIM